MKFASALILYGGMGKVATKTTLPGYVRLEQAGQIIGVDPATVWRYINAGLLDALRFGNTHLVKEADVRKFKRPKTGRPPIQARKRA